MDNVKVELNGTHRESIEDIKKKTGLSFNQIINHVWAHSTDVLTNLVKAHAAKNKK